MSIRALITPLAIAALLATVWYSEYVVRPKVEPGPVHVVYWEKWTEFEGDAMRAVVEAFNRKQNRVHVDLLTISGIQDKTLMAVAGGDPPDVAGLYGPNVAQYADDHAILPLDNYCRTHGITASRYIPSYWDIGWYRNHVFALPSTPASTALHYNERMLADVGVTKPPETIEEMDALAARLFQRDARGRITRAGFMPSEPGWWNWAWGPMFGGKLWNGKDRITANDARNIRALEWVQSYPRKYGKQDLDTFRSGFGSFSSPQNAFLSEQVAMELQGVWMSNFIKMYSPNLVGHWRAVPFPHPADRPDLAEATIVDEDVLVIPRGAKHPDEAFEFIAYVQSQEGMELLCMGQRKNTPLVDVSPEFYAHHPNPYIQLFAELPKGKNAIAAPKMGLWPEYQSELNAAFDDIMLLRKSPREAMEYVQGRMQPKLDDYLKVLRLRGEAP